MRYSQLAPIPRSTQLLIAFQACAFFQMDNYRQNCEILGKPVSEKQILPFTGFEFMTFLQKQNILSDPHAQMERLRELLERLCHAGLLQRMSVVGGTMMGTTYYFMKEFTIREHEGLIWLASALGEAFLCDMSKPAVVQITGRDSKGDVTCGSGVVVHAHHILTCAHVLSDMTVDSEQTFQGVKCVVQKLFSHPSIDVGIVRVDAVLAPVGGLTFDHPHIAQPLISMGYPKIIGTRDSAIVLHRGEVTCEQVTALAGDQLFLFPAISRPGNSGGPIVSMQGHILGIVSRDILAEDGTVSPYYAAVPTREIKRAVAEMSVGIQLPIEDYR